MYVINHFSLAAFKILSSSLPLCALNHSVKSYSLRPKSLESTRLLCPWNFPGKSMVIGYYFLLQGILLIQGSNPCLLYLLYCRKILYYCTTWEAPLTLHSLIILCLSMVFFGYFLVYFFELIESLSISFPRFGKSGAIVSSDKLSAPFSCSSFAIPIIWIRST